MTRIGKFYFVALSCSLLTLSLCATCVRAEEQANRAPAKDQPNAAEIKLAKQLTEMSPEELASIRAIKFPNGHLLEVKPSVEAKTAAELPEEVYHLLKTARYHQLGKERLATEAEVKALAKMFREQAAQLPEGERAAFEAIITGFENSAVPEVKGMGKSVHHPSQIIHGFQKDGEAIPVIAVQGVEFTNPTEPGSNGAIRPGIVIYDRDGKTPKYIRFDSINGCLHAPQCASQDDDRTTMSGATDSKCQDANASISGKLDKILERLENLENRVDRMSGN